MKTLAILSLAIGVLASCGGEPPPKLKLTIEQKLKIAEIRKACDDRYPADICDCVEEMATEKYDQFFTAGSDWLYHECVD